MESRPPEPRPTLTRTQLRALAAAVAVLAIAVPLLLVSRPPASPGSSPAPSQVAAESASPQPATPVPSAPEEAWGPLALEPFQPIASLTAAASDAAGIAAKAAFVVESLTDEPATVLAARLQTMPPTTLKVTPGADARHATVTPAKPLQAGTAYRFTLRSQVGTLQGSWAFRVRGPVRVLSTLPGDATTGVPTATGIEVTFDQEDVADMAAFFSIEPSTKGRFERHGRTQVFVPDRLEASTVYTVRIKAGLPRTGTDLHLERDVVFRFETTGRQAAAVRWLAGRDVLEASPAEVPAIGLVARTLEDPDGAEPPIPTTVEVRVYRYPSDKAAADALQAFLVSPRWMEHSGPVLGTRGLDLELTFTAKLAELPDPWSEQNNHRVLRLPSKLPVGAYAVEIAGQVPAYVFLQVTRVSAWVAVLSDRTALWVNDVVAHGAISGATVALPGHEPFGTSRDDGIVNARTPSALLPAAVSGDASTAPPILVVRAGTSRLLVAFDAASAGEIYRGEWWEGRASGDETYWSLLETDRWQYRITDSVAAWGFLRARDANEPPAEVTVRLVSDASSSLLSGPAIAEARVQPDSAGVYSAKLAIDRAPLGRYTLVAVASGRVVAMRSLMVSVIHKPDYQVELVTDHLAAVAGSPIELTATATFFDGTPVPDVVFRFSSGYDDDRSATSNAAGVATATSTATYPDWETDSDPSSQDLHASPAGAEGGEIGDGASVVVFPASEHLAAEGTLTGDRLRVTGTLRAVDLARVEVRLRAGDWDGDPEGAVVSGRKVRVTVTELIPVKTKIGTRYDYIEKVVVPLYRYETKLNEIRSTSITSDASGRIVLDMTVPSADHEYEVAFATVDSASRPVLRTTHVGRPFLERPFDTVVFDRTDGVTDDDQYRLGEVVDWTMKVGGAPLPSGEANRYMYIVAQRGLVAVSTTDSPRFRRPFAASDAPGIFIMGVRFTGTTYAPKAAKWANFDTAQRALTVTVTADRPAYRPRDPITLTVRAVNEAGHPVSASVVLQAVDEKLYAMGAASTPEPMWQLYQRVDSGIVRLTSTHQVPTASGGEGEGGDGGGDGGARTDFRDMLAFVRLQTNANGMATTVIRASDDLTAWHISASALTGRLQAGVGELVIPVGLPVFANVTAADAYLVTDRPAIRLRAFGTELRAGDPVRFTVTSTSLGLATTTIDTTAFTDAWVTLPGLRLGRHELDVSVVASSRKDAAGRPYADRLVTPFEVITSRTTVDRTAYGELGSSEPTVPSGTAATYTFTDAGRARYLPALLDVMQAASARLDRGLARSLAILLLQDAYGRSPESLPGDALDVSRYQLDGPQQPDWGSLDDYTTYGISLLPYGSSDPWVAARVVVLDPTFDRAEDLRWMLGLIRDEPSLPRELRIAALAALGSLGEPVLADVRTVLGEKDLTAYESIHVALAAAGAGDETTAREIERALLAAHGQRLGPWVRLNAATGTHDVSDLTATLAVLAARIGDPLARDMLAYVVAHPSAQTSHDLEILAAITALLDRTPATKASFAYTVDGARTVVDLAAGGAHTISLTAAQVASLRLERLSGEVGVTAVWRDATGIGGASDPTIALVRTAPATTPADRLVTVSMQATFRSGALDAPCYVVVEQVPSGLVPLSDPPRDRETEGSVIWPMEVVGQEVRFCVSRDPEHRTASATLRYIARVVSTGTFTWEPAVMGLEGVSEITTTTGGSSVRIGG